MKKMIVFVLLLVLLFTSCAVDDKNTRISYNFLECTDWQKIGYQGDIKRCYDKNAKIVCYFYDDTGGNAMYCFSAFETSLDY